MDDPSQIFPIIRQEIVLIALDQSFRCDRLQKSDQRVIGEICLQLLRLEGLPEDHFSDSRLPL